MWKVKQKYFTYNRYSIKFCQEGLELSADEQSHQHLQDCQTCQNQVWTFLKNEKPAQLKNWPERAHD